jgi:uncharacterized protein YacL
VRRRAVTEHALPGGGRTLIVVGDAQSKYFLDNERGVLAQFRHQHFLLFLIAHFQRAALLDSTRRHTNTLLRLTVVTTFGLIGTVTTGFIGMNLIALTEIPLIEKIIFFLVIFAPIAFLTFYTIVKSRRLSDFLDVLSDESVSARDKFKALIDVGRKKRVIDE